MNNKLFVYGIDDQDFLTLKKYITVAKVYALDDSILNDTVKEVTDIPYMNYTCSKKDNAFLLLASDDNGSGWKMIIDQLKKAKLDINFIKISVTNSNLKWPMHILFEHVLSEDKLFKKRLELKQEMVNASSLNQDNSNEDFINCLSKAFSIYQDDKSSVDDMIHIIDELKMYEGLS